MKRLQALRGMPDILPSDTLLWRDFEARWVNLMNRYGYEEIRLPILESTSLFKRSIGEVTDIVEKEMFSFFDRDGEGITLRPEGTAGCVRAGLEHGLLHNAQKRLWYSGPMFRYERPQKGRYRQFHQVGVESFGFEGPDIEVEHILLMHRFWREAGFTEGVIKLQINSLGSPLSRQYYREKLVEYLSPFYKILDEDSQRRLQTNPLRILDSKNPQMASIIAGAPKFQDYLDEHSERHFNEFKQALDEAKVPYNINPNLVRGLDYYNQTVYEWVTDQLGSQGTVCAGGRYNDLVTELGGSKTPAVGFAMGIERFLLLWKVIYAAKAGVDVYLIHAFETFQSRALCLAEKIRDACPYLRVVTHCGGGQFKQQFKKADKCEARIALILGEQEWATGHVSIKFLREERLQESITIEGITDFLKHLFLGD